MRKKKNKEEKVALAGLWSRHLYLTKVQKKNIRRENYVYEVPGSKPTQGIIIDWLAFKQYLSKTYNNSPNTAKIRLCYAKKFYHVLYQNDAHDLLANGSGESVTF
jgi:hypothetical protein